MDKVRQSLTDIIFSVLFELAEVANSIDIIYSVLFELAEVANSRILANALEVCIENC